MDFTEYLPIDAHFAYRGHTVAVPQVHLLELLESNLERLRTFSGGFRLSPTSKQLQSWGIAVPLPFSASQPTTAELERLHKQVEAEVKTPQTVTDYSIYTGVTGYAAGLFHVYCGLFGDSGERLSQLALQCLREAVTLLRSIEPQVRGSAQKNQGIGFYCGVSGYLALRAAVERAAYLHEENQKPQIPKNGSMPSPKVQVDYSLNLPVGKSMHEPFANELLKMEKVVLAADTPDELLYGRAGYLYCLAFLQKHGIAVDDALLRRVIGKVFSAGVEEASRATSSSATGQKSRWPLMWRFFGTKYLGAAHGVAGIAYMLLCWWELLKEDQKSLLLKTIEKLSELVESGSFTVLDMEPGNDEQKAEHLMHWCHGAPGLTTLFCKTFLLTRSKRFLATAEKCASLIWEQGRLRKGTGLCHGVAGNAYAFLALYRLNQDQKYLYNALEFFHTVFGAVPPSARQAPLSEGDPPEQPAVVTASLIPVLASDEDSSSYRSSVMTYVDPQRHISNCPDHPLSLMEGEMGVLCFIADLLHPSQSHFPGFETSTNPPVSGEWLDRRYFPFCLPSTRAVFRHPPEDKTIYQREACHFFEERITPAVWAVPMMEPGYCDRLLQEIYGTTTKEKMVTDAIRLTGKFAPLVAGLTGFLQRFVERVMLPTNRDALLFPQSQHEASSFLNPKRRGSEVRRNSDPVSHMVVPSEGETICFAPNRVALLAGATPSQILSEQLATKLLTSRAEAAPNSFDVVNGTMVMPQLKVWRAYVIRYDATNHPSIQSHTDACDVTFNLCLRRTCKKGELVFNDGSTIYRHKVGEAVIFWGDAVHHTHAVGPKGERAQLVLLLNFQFPHRILDSKWLRGQTLPRERFPAEVLGYIFEFLPLWDLASVMYCNREFYALANDNDAWQWRYERNAELMRFCPISFLQTPPTCVRCGEASSKLRPLVRCETCQQFCHLWTDDDDEKGPRCRGPFSQEAQGSQFYSVNVPRDLKCYFCSFKREEEKRPPLTEADSISNNSGSDIFCRSSPTDFAPGFRVKLDWIKPGYAEARAEERFRFKLLPFDAEEPGAWKEVYRAVRAVAGEVAEMFRVAAKQESKNWWRAIIGMYPVHNLRRAHRMSEGSEGDPDEEDGSPTFCEECE